MSKAFHTITTFAFIALTTLPVSFSVAFLGSQAYIWNKMKQELKHRQLETFILHKKDLHWVEKDRELLINHHMFDVESMVERPDGMIELKGLFDKVEDQLNAQLDILMRNQTKQQTTNVLAFLCYHFVYEDSQTLSHNILPAAAGNATHTGFYSDFVKPVYLTRHLPPPKA